MVFIYPDDDIGGRLISLPVNTSGTTQALSEAQMKSKFKLEMANVTLTSQLIKNSTTNKYKGKSINKDGSTVKNIWKSYIKMAVLTRLYNALHIFCSTLPMQDLFLVLLKTLLFETNKEGFGVVDVRLGEE